MKAEILFKLHVKLMEAAKRQTGNGEKPSGHMRGLREAIKIVEAMEND